MFFGLGVLRCDVDSSSDVWMLAVRLSSIYSFLWTQVAAGDIIELTRVTWNIGCISAAGDIVVDIIFLFSISGPAAQQHRQQSQ